MSLTIETAYDNMRKQELKEKNYDWVFVSDIEKDFPYGLENFIDDIGGWIPYFYIVICNGGSTKIAYPMWWVAYYNGKREIIREWKTSPGSIPAYEVVAYKLIDMPEQLIQTILQNPRSKRSKFYEFYGN